VLDGLTTRTTRRLTYRPTGTCLVRRETLDTRAGGGLCAPATTAVSGGCGFPRVAKLTENLASFYHSLGRDALSGRQKRAWLRRGRRAYGEPIAYVDSPAASVDALVTHRDRRSSIVVMTGASRVSLAKELEHFLIRIPDVLLATVLASATAVWFWCRRAGRKDTDPGHRTLLVFNTFYSLHRLRQRKATHLISSRDLDGYFHHVWSVHALIGASPDESEANAFGRPTSTRLSDRHTVIEASIGRFRAVRTLRNFNFILSQVALLRHLARIDQQRHLGIVRGDDPQFNGMWAFILARLCDIPFEVRVNGNQDAIYDSVGALAFPKIFRRRWIEKGVERFTLSRADIVGVASEDNEGFALKNGARPDRLARITNARLIDPVHFSDPRDRAAVNGGLSHLDGRPFVMCVSRLEPVKHPQDVVDALAKARERLPQLAGVIAGEGSMRDELEAFRQKLGLQNDLLLVGDRDQEWLAGMLCKAAVVASPLTGLALVEAGLSATPIVAYETEWHSEILSHGETGLLVPYRDTAAMAAAICELVANPEMAQAMGHKARAVMLDWTDPRPAAEQERELMERLFAMARDD
jgi:glycosyltransferase involved in cell wall biosynthesis